MSIDGEKSESWSQGSACSVHGSFMEGEEPGSGDPGSHGTLRDSSLRRAFDNWRRHIGQLPPEPKRDDGPDGKSWMNTLRAMTAKQYSYYKCAHPPSTPSPCRVGAPANPPGAAHRQFVPNAVITFAEVLASPHCRKRVQPRPPCVPAHDLRSPDAVRPPSGVWNPATLLRLHR